MLRCKFAPASAPLSKVSLGIPIGDRFESLGRANIVYGLIEIPEAI